MPTPTFAAVPVNAWEIEVGDQIQHPTTDDTVTVTGITGPVGVQRFTTTGGVVRVDVHDPVLLLAPIGQAVDGGTVYVANGTGIFACRCVYRLVGVTWCPKIIVDSCASHGGGPFGYEEDDVDGTE